MRFVVNTRLISAVPPEQLPSIMERFADWREQYRDRTESFEFYAGGGGGFMVVDVPDEVELNQMMSEYPFMPYLEVDIRPIIDGDTGLGQWWQVMRQMLGNNSS
jgi:muconolactone delta-isomerase